MRTIDADALVQEFEGRCICNCDKCKYYTHAHCGLIDNAPTVEQPTGEWITRHRRNSFGQDIVCFECNKCGEYKLPIIHTMITKPLGVCPNCGAKMKEGETNDE